MTKRRLEKKNSKKISSWFRKIGYNLQLIWYISIGVSIFFVACFISNDKTSNERIEILLTEKLILSKRFDRAQYSLGI